MTEQMTHRVLAALTTADLDEGSAADALVRFLAISWSAFEGAPFLLHLASPAKNPEQEHDQREPILAPLERLIRRGQDSGEFDATLPAGGHH
jgi:hypothetical protein